MSLIQEISQHAEFVSGDTWLRDVAALMACSEAGVVGITRNGWPIGTITDHDLLKSAISLGRDLSKFRAKHVMELRPITIEWNSDSSDLIDAAIVMRRNHARNAIVMRGGIPVGIVSFSALCKCDLTA